MPAKSKKQQKFFGMVHARQKGKDVGGPEIEKVAKEIDFDDAEDFASTKHKGLPEKVKDETTLWKKWLALREAQIPPPPPPKSKRQTQVFTNSEGKPVTYPKVPLPPQKVNQRPPLQSSEYDSKELELQRQKWGGRNPFGN